ncbi:MAG: hypothetical protein Q4A01_01965 [Coriobacteriales bacterium]|nr:hypothetical protein [Coriobacteriales bacterium]
MRETRGSWHLCAARAAAALLLGVSLAACGASAPAQKADPEPAVTEQDAATTDATDASTAKPQEKAATLADGTYQIEAQTDSSMFRSEHCTLTVADGSYTATLALPGEGFSKLYFGTAEEAENASEDDIYEFFEGDDGKYTFEIPVAALDEPLPIAAFGHRRDRWYDHTITFVSPSQDAQADAA